MKHSYYIFTSLILVFLFLSCSENKGEPSLDAITQQIIDNGMSVSENGCDTAIAFPYTSNGYQTRIEYQDGNSKCCTLKDCFSSKSLTGSEYKGKKINVKKEKRVSNNAFFKS